MPNDNFNFPPRLIGYGAYNLCFDTFLARSGGMNFFQYIRSRPELDAINLVKVICFRKSTQEDLPPPLYDGNGVPLPTSRTQPLFRRDGLVNAGFLENLLKLVREAANPQLRKKFWVQVCIFHHQAIAADNDGKFEDPEDRPRLLDPTKLGTTNCDRLTKFFTIDDTTQDGKDRFALQKSILMQICGKLRMETNVLFEIGNEIRVQGCGGAGENDKRNCAMAAWTEAMAESVLSAIFWDHEPAGTSTGSNNEQNMFDKIRPGACPATSIPYRPFFFDFHSVQWGIPLNDINSTGYIEGIPNAKTRALRYMNQYLQPGTPLFTKPFLIINDDGAKFGEETAPGEKEAHAQLIEKWARVAFQKGLHYASKQQYPPVGWDEPALQALRRAATEPLV